VAASGHYEYSIPDTGDSTLQIFSTKTMSRSLYSARETLDLLHFLQSHQAEIEEKAKQEVQQSKQPKSHQERINNLFQ